MSKKLWYSIEIECVKYDALSTMLVGEKNIVAKVKSKGLAILIAKNLENVYKTDQFKISIK